MVTIVAFAQAKPGKEKDLEKALLETGFPYSERSGLHQL